MTSKHHLLLHEWYKKNGRNDLPWRNTQDAYAILVSEVMLQQTQVKTVLERFYFPFLERFPTLEILASASQNEVLKLWQGLGYYNRAINLHKTAKLTAPHLPKYVNSLIALPGIGKNTAHAVAAFAYHEPFPVMEANVKRILYRLFALKKATDNELWRHAEKLLDTNNPFSYNQAMMDIGAMVCTKNNPSCSSCPLSTICEGKIKPILYPVPKTKKNIPVRQKNIVVFSHADRFYVTPRETRFLNGLFGFNEYKKGKPIIFYNQRYLPSDFTLLGKVEQVYSHFKLDAEVYYAVISDYLGVSMSHWKTYGEVLALPTSKADEKIIRLLDQKGITQHQQKVFA